MEIFEIIGYILAVVGIIFIITFKIINIPKKIKFLICGSWILCLLITLLIGGINCLFKSSNICNSIICLISIISIIWILYEVLRDLISVKNNNSINLDNEIED